MMEWILRSLLNSDDFDNENVVFKNIEVKGQSIPYYQAGRKSSMLNNRIISIYIIIDYMILDQLGMLNSEKTFNLFQNEFFSELFYNTRNDLRWNIYFIIVSNNEIEYTDTMVKIENNDDFMRKYFMSKKEFELFITHEYLNKNEKLLSNNIEILYQWELILKESGLEGCIYNKYNTQSVIDYIEKGKKIQSIGRPNKYTSNILINNNLRIDKVERLLTNFYRVHCFGEHIDLPLGNINLISGSNGSGKSSICEAIEYGLTGSIYNQKDTCGEVLLDCKNTENNKVIFNSNKTSAEIRTIDMAWYGTTSIGRKVSLNNNFTIFNYLNANASTKYSGKDIDINELLKNLIFGEDVTESYLKINRFNEEFNKEFKQRNKIISEINFEIEKLTESLRDNNDNNDVSVIWYQINEILEMCSINYDLEYYQLNNEEKIQFLINIFELTSKDVKYIMNYIFSKNDITINDILVKQNKLKEKVNSYELLQDKINSNSKIINEKNNYINKLIKNIEELNYSNYEVILQSATSLFGSNDILSFNNFRNEYGYSIFIKSKLIDILNRYEEVFTINFDNEENEDIYSIDINEIENDLSINKVNLINIKNEIKCKENNLNKITNLRNQLIEVGKSIITNEKGYRSCCPLCGHNYLNNEELLLAINNTIDLYGNVNNEMNDLINKKDNLINTIEELKKQIEKIKHQKELRIRKVNLINELKSFMELNDQISIEKIKSLLNFKIEEINRYLIREEEKYNYILDIEKSMTYIQFEKESNSNNFAEYCSNMIETIKKARSEIEQEIINIKLDIKKLETKTKELNKELLGKENFIDELNEINLTVQSIKKIMSLFNIEQSNIKLYDWCQQYEICNNLVKEIDIINNRVQNNNILQKQIEDLRGKLNTIKNEKNRCHSALNAFKSIKPLELYMKDFISQNAEHIEKIFKLIHKPKEFSNLRIQDGIVSFTRTKTGETTDATKISTGQSTSLTFSILLTLYMSAIYAPKLIILDEPITNMDDMHILNLIDIIRELVLNGTQIIITTANDQIAKFLRRKFSCMEDSFKHIILNRINDNQTQIFEVIYSPNEEGYKSKTEII